MGFFIPNHVQMLKPQYSIRRPVLYLLSAIHHISLRVFFQFFEVLQSFEKIRVYGFSRFQFDGTQLGSIFYQEVDLIATYISPEVEFFMGFVVERPLHPFQQYEVFEELPFREVHSFPTRRSSDHRKSVV